MKRTPLHRSGSLARGGAIATRSAIQRGPPPKRVCRLRKQGARAHRDREQLVVFRTKVLARAGGRCERCAEPFRARDLHAHHIVPRARGGAHTPDNGAALCKRCHDLVHTHEAPDWRRWIKSPRDARQHPLRLV